MREHEFDCAYGELHASEGKDAILSGTASFQKTLTVRGRNYRYCAVDQIDGVKHLPRALKVLLENVLRTAADENAARMLAGRIVEAGLAGQTGQEVEFAPARVLFQDFTGVPVFVDFAAMRKACVEMGGDPATINPLVPCDLVIDHSVIADVAGCAEALKANMVLESKRNAERYGFLKWSQESFDNVRIVPPGSGICHQLNIEQFAHVVMTNESEAHDEALAYFDTLVGTDSHTPTANGVGVLGWGVGGIEAEAAALGQPITTLVPQVVGVRLVGELKPGVMGMDVALTFAETLRAEGVVGCFVECFGEGIASLSATQRACIANMTPEYGCTCTLFPVDDRTIDYLRLTGRESEQLALIEAYAKAQGCWGEHGGVLAGDPIAAEDDCVYARIVEIDLGAIEPSIAGPSRPHDRIALSCAQNSFKSLCEKRELDASECVTVALEEGDFEISHGAIAIAAITSCTTATDPAMMLAAGLLAKNATEAGLAPKPWVKTIFAPGSKATELLLAHAGLLESLQKEGFYTCGFGCMSCIGNSGPLCEPMHAIADSIELTSVLSGNRNFDGRISPDVAQNYLMAPALVVAYALAGTMDIDLTKDALGVSNDGEPVYLRDLLPSAAKIDELMNEFATNVLYEEGARGTYEGSESWRAIDVSGGDLYSWDDASTYVRCAPYFDELVARANADSENERADASEAVWSLEDACVLGKFGDFITTDHISPAGSIALDSPAARYLESHGVAPADFNSYGSRRGNHEVMMRGTFANVKLRNELAEGRVGGFTRNHLTGQIETIFDASMAYKDAGIDSIIVAGKLYGSGSSRDWAGKGPMLLGVRAVIAESFERIHRSNLIGMGILPLQFLDGQNAETLGLTGHERFSIDPIDCADGLPRPSTVRVHAKDSDGVTRSFEAIVRIDTPTEGHYFTSGGILQYVLENR